ncbi:MAG: acetyl-coenzyme A synthetase N-terminal domain-containing protein [Spirochaetaceae bacterium]
MEQQTYAPTFAWQAGARLRSMEQYWEMYRRSIADPHGFWEEQARERLRWDVDFHGVEDTDFAHGAVAWFLGGKLMSRILRKIAERRTEELGDISTLADPSVVDALIEARMALPDECVSLQGCFD